MIFGIDLGTTNSLIGRIEKGGPRLFQDQGSSLIPSMVCFQQNSEPPLVGAAARNALLENVGHTVYNAKRFLGKGAADVAELSGLLPFDLSPSTDKSIQFKVGTRNVTPTQVSSLVLKRLKNLAEQQTGEKVSKVVITTPAYFNDAQRQATKQAGELAGLEVVRIINEPTAACLAYGLNKKTMGVVAVFDLGGGTFDISILRVVDGVFEVLATHGDTALGGGDFDEAIVQALANEIDAHWGKHWRESADAKARLLTQAEAVKKALTTEESATLKASFEEKNFERKIARDELENWIRPVANKLRAPCLSCLKDAGMEAGAITDVLLVGGSTRVPLVKNLVQDLFRREPICTLNPDEVVAVGAAVQGSILTGQTGGMLLLDVIPLSLGIETMGGVVSKILHRNSSIPVSASQVFTTYAEGQTSVDIHILQGERELATDNRSLARFQLKGIPPLPAGVPKIEVEFIIDANGILNVQAIELRTSTRASVTVNPSYGLSDAEVERILLDSFDHAETDFAARFLIEARTEADSILRATRKSLQRGIGLISEPESKRISLAIDDLESTLAATEHTVIRAKISELDEATRVLADKMLANALQSALTQPPEGTRV